MNQVRRNLVVALSVVAAALICGILVAANCVARSKYEAKVAEAKDQAERLAQEKDAREEAVARIKTLEDENADLRRQLKQASADLKQALADLKQALADLKQQADRLAVLEQDKLRLQADLDAALKQVAELTRKYAQARDAERKARLDVAKKAAVTVVTAPETKVVHVGNKKHNHKNGGDGNVSANKGRGGVASLPRTTPSFSELDTDHDGRLTLEEYKAGFPDAVDVEKEFKALDTNGDGVLSIDEYKAGHPDPPVVHTTRKKN